MKSFSKLLFLLTATTISAIHGVAQNISPMEQPTRDDYNLKGNIIAMTALTKTEGNDMNFQEKWVFDSNGRLTHYEKKGFGQTLSLDYPRPKPQSQGTWSHYDDDGDLLETRTYNMDSSLKTSVHYIYNSHGERCGHIQYNYSTDGTGTVAERRVTRCDKTGKPLDIYHYAADDEPLVEEHYKYDKKGNVTKRTTTFHETGETHTDTYRYRYDKQGKWTSLHYLRDKKEQWVRSHAYQYDAQGNWTEDIYSENGTRLQTISRTLTYAQP